MLSALLLTGTIAQDDPTPQETIDALVHQRFTQTAAVTYNPTAQAMTATAVLQTQVDEAFARAVTATAAASAEAAYTATAQAVTLAHAGQPARFDTDDFLDTHFHLQARYNRVLCVSQHDDCPDQIETTVPCLTGACDHLPQTYPVEAKLNNLQLASSTANPGDLVIIMPGQYSGLLVDRKSGADGAYIHFKAWGEPGQVVVNTPGDPDRNNDFLFYFIAADYYIIEGIAFRDAPRAGLFITGAFEETGRFATHFIITNIYSHDNGDWGMLTGPASYLVIQDSVFTNSRVEHGLYISGSGDNMIIRRNVFQGNASAGLQINPDPHEATLQLFGWLTTISGNTCGLSEGDVSYEGRATWTDVEACYKSQGLPDLGEFMTDGIGQNILVEQNIFTGNGSSGGTALNMAALRDSMVRNNLFYNNYASGIDCGDDYYAQAKNLEVSPFACQRVYVVNNTSVDAGEDYAASVLTFWGDARDMVSANNIIVRAREDAYQILDQADQGLVSRRNYYYSLWIQNPGGMALLEDSLTGFSIEEALMNFTAPGFEPWVLANGEWYQRNPNRPDFHPLPGSPLVGAGDPLYTPPLDLEGDARTGADIGALMSISQ